MFESLILNLTIGTEFWIMHDYNGTSKISWQEYDCPGKEIPELRSGLKSSIRDWDPNLKLSVVPNWNPNLNHFMSGTGNEIWIFSVTGTGNQSWIYSVTGTVNLIWSYSFTGSGTSYLTNLVSGTRTQIRNFAVFEIIR